MLYIFFCGLVVLPLFPVASELSTLRQIHVLFRHGERTPDEFSSYIKDPYINHTYYPTGHGELTQIGKMQEYTIGLNLRERYDTFLGDIYASGIMEARSTDYSRTKMSLLLALAGLWPPADSQRWNSNLNWQPIPFLYEPLNNDKIFRLPYSCQYLLNEYNRLYELDEVKQLLEPYKWIFDYVNEHAGINATQVVKLSGLYFTLATQQGLGMELPEWTKTVFPHALAEMVPLDYNLRTYTKEMLKLSAGGFINKIRNDIFDYIQKKNSIKLYLYSGHELTVATILKAFDIYYSHIPNYGSYIIIELHQIGYQYGLKFFYTDYSQEIPTQVILPNCTEFCPLDRFLWLTDDVTDPNFEC